MELVDQKSLLMILSFRWHILGYLYEKNWLIWQQ